MEGQQSSYPIDDAYVQATIQAESKGDPNAVSPSGAKGLMQLEDATGIEEFNKLKKTGSISQDEEYDPFNPTQNVKVGSAYLQELHDRYKGDKALTSAAYNAGLGNVDKAIKDYGNSYDAIAAKLPKPGETVPYVSRVLSGYNKNKKVSETSDDSGSSPAEPTLQDKLSKSIADVNPTAQGFAKAIQPIYNDPEFDSLSYQDKAALMSQAFHAKPWDKNTYGVFKKTMGFIADSTDPEELPKLDDIIGAPPVVPAGKDPKATLETWKHNEVQKLLAQGVSPAVFGDRLDSYFDNATKAETDAFAIRNQSTFGKDAAYAGNFVSDLVKGAASNVFNSVAGAVRTGIDPTSLYRTANNLINGDAKARAQAADIIQGLPDYIGKPFNTTTYNTTATGKLVLNQDGTPQTLAESHASQVTSGVAKLIGQVGGLVAGGAELKALGAETSTIGALFSGTNTLMLANDSYKSVYDATNGDAGKAYTASLFALPAAEVGAIGELSIISKSLSPVFLTMSKYDQARYLAQSLVKHVAVGAAAGAAMSETQEFGKSLATGKPIDQGAVAENAGVMALIGGTLGPGADYMGGRAEFLNTGTELVKFRDSADLQRTISTQQVPQDLLRTFGIDAVPTSDGGTTLTKRTTINPESLTLPQVVQALKSIPLPDEIVALGKRQGELANKEVKTPEENAELTKLNQVIPLLSAPEHVNNIKALESAFSDHIDDNPGAFLVRYDKENGVWEDVENGNKSPHLKDVLFRKAPPVPEEINDVSDISHIRVLDEDTIRSQGVGAPPEAKAAEEHLNLGRQLDSVNQELLDLKTKRASIKQEVPPTEEPVNPKATEEALNLNRKLDSINQDLLSLKNRKDVLDPEDLEGQTLVKQQLRAKNIEKRNVQKDLLKTKASVDVEEAQRTANRQSAKDANKERFTDIDKQIQDKNAQKRDLQKQLIGTKAAVDIEQSQAKAFKEATDQRSRDLGTIAQTKKKGLGAIVNSKGETSIVIPSGLSEGAKEQVTAHEVGHAVTDKVKLSPETDKAVDERINDLKSRGKVSSAKEIANEVFLPEVRDIVKTPDVPANKLDRASTNALFGKREFLANQIAGVMLKRAGRDIGDFKILPEIEADLKNTKLPDVGAKVNASESPTATSPTTSNQVNSSGKFDFVLDSDSTAEGRKQFEDVKDEHPGTTVTLKNGENVKLLNAVTKDGREGKISAFDKDGKKIGELDVARIEVEDNPGKRFNPSVYVEDSHKRQGLATAMYDLAKSTGGLIPPSSDTGQVRTEEGQAFREAYDEQSKAVEPPIQPFDTDTNTQPFDVRTGNQKETAFSKTLSENVPSHPKTFYEEASRSVGQPGADAFVDKHGIDKVTEQLSDPESFNIDPRQRILIADTLLDRTKTAFDANPTPENREALSKAEQIRAAALTTNAQALALARRFRSAKTFSDLISSIDKVYRESGIEPPNYTEYMLAELKARFERANRLPSGSRARDAEVNQIFNETIKAKGTTIPEFLSKYMLTNMLSGTGTQIVTGVSGMWMGPIVTALNHPFEGAGLMWRTMVNAHDAAMANAGVALQGKPEKSLFYSNLNPSPVEQPVTSTASKIFYAISKKFSLPIRMLQATHEYTKTLSGEQLIAHTKLQELKAKYGDDPQRLSVETAKILTNKTDRDTAVKQARDEYKIAGLPATESEVHARAYEILRKDDAASGLVDRARDYGYAMSHAGAPANVLPQFADAFLGMRFWDSHPILKVAKFIAQPVGRAMVRISDYGTDFIPGNILIDKVYRGIGSKVEPRTEAQQIRLQAGQKIGTIAALSVYGLIKGGAFRLTGDPEKQEGKQAGQTATNRADFKEFEAKGDPDYSIIFPGGGAIKYKDFPGINAVLYGIWKMDKDLDGGASVPHAAWSFMSGAFKYATPFVGGGTLNEPIVKLFNSILNPEQDEKGFQKSWEDFQVSTAKGLIPWESLLRDIQHTYTASPEESHQSTVQKIFKDIPGIATMVGSRESTDRLGTPIQKSILDRIPGVGRILSAVKDANDPIMEKIREKQLSVDEMPNTVTIIPSRNKATPLTTAYTATREERLGKAYANVLTADEWNEFRQATAPYIKNIAEAVADSNIPHDDAQALLTKRIHSIDTQALKRYVATGHF